VIITDSVVAESLLAVESVEVLQALKPRRLTAQKPQILFAFIKVVQS
jgi:hypothetical protein